MAFVHRHHAAVFNGLGPVTLAAGQGEGFTLIAEAHGWSAETPPCVGENVAYQVIERSDGSRLPAFVPHRRAGQL